MAALLPRALLVIAGLAACRRAEPPVRAAPPPQPPPIAQKLPAPPPPAPVAPPLSLDEIARRALPSLAKLRCRGQEGVGFFLGDELLIAAAHDACPEGEAGRVLLRDGRELLGRTEARDEELDLARVEVAGAAARPLAAGDSTAMKAGDRVVWLYPAPREGRLRDSSRALLGVAFLEFDDGGGAGFAGDGRSPENAASNDAAAAGPLLDSQGRVVGLVALRLGGGESFALPIEYARVPEDDAARRRWNAALQAAQAAGAEQRQALAAQTRRPWLLGLERTGAAVEARLVERFEGGPRTSLHSFEVTQGGRPVCTASGAFAVWVPLGQAALAGRERAIAALLRTPVARDLYSGTAPLDFSECAALADGPARIALRDGGEERGAADLAADDLRAIRSAAESARRAAEEQRLRADADRRRRDDVTEAQWRNAFRIARARIDRAEATLLEARRSMPTYPSMQKWRQLRWYERELSRARADLDELDRKASLRAIPREWRR